MKHYKTAKKKQTSIIANLLFGYAAACIVTLGITLIMTTLLAKHWMSEDGIDAGCITAIILSSVVASLITIKRAGERKALTCVGVVVLYYLSLLCSNAIWFSGKYLGTFGTLLTIVGCAAVIIILNTKNAKQRIRYSKR